MCVAAIKMIREINRGNEKNILRRNEYPEWSMQIANLAANGLELGGKNTAYVNAFLGS